MWSTKFSARKKKKTIFSGQSSTGRVGVGVGVGVRV